MNVFRVVRWYAFNADAEIPDHCFVLSRMLGVVAHDVLITVFCSFFCTLEFSLHVFYFDFGVLDNQSHLLATSSIVMEPRPSPNICKIPNA
jgi:hypothetical protein